MNPNSDIQIQATHDTLNEIKNKKVLMNPDEKKTTSAFLYFAATVANLNALTLGVTIIWISPVTSKLLSYNVSENPLEKPISTLELSLIGSLSQTGMIIGPLLLERIYNKFGRRRSLNIVSILVIICYIILAFSKHIYLYYALILMIGILLGGNSVGLSMYISEITEDHNRGKISCYMGSFIPIGNLYGFVLGSFFSVKVFTLLCSIPSLVMVILSEMFLPETPQYLINKRRKDDAIKALERLWGKQCLDVEKLSRNIKLTEEQTNENSFKLVFCNKSTRNGFIICSVLTSMNACTGLPAIMSYLELIFEMAGTEVSGSIYAIVIGIVQIICYIIASLLVEKLGRRPLLLFSALTSIFPLTGLGTFYFLKNSDSPLIENIKWVPVVGVTVLMVTAIIGICSVTPAFMNEVFTSDAKSAAMSLIYFISGVIFTLSIFLFPLMMETIGLAWSFWLFAVLCALGFIFIYFQVPETKGKNIMEIQELLIKKRECDRKLGFYLNTCLFSNNYFDNVFLCIYL